MKDLLYPLIFFLLLTSCNKSHVENHNLIRLDHIANSMHNDLSNTRKNLIHVANTLQHKIYFDDETKDISENLYQYTPNGMLVSKYKIDRSAIYYPSDSIDLHQVKKMIINSEQMDSFFVKLIDENLLLSQVYFMDTNSFLRIYPFISFENYIETNTDLNKFMPYQFVKNKPFMNDKAYWLNFPYADPYGRGWIFSCIEPIYYRDHFLGILSGDISLQCIKAKYLSSDTEMLLLIDQTSKVICCTKEAGKLINIPQLRDFGYYKPITEDILRADVPILIEHNNKTICKAINSLMSGSTSEKIFIDNKKYTIYKSLIEETDWYLLKIIN